MRADSFPIILALAVSLAVHAIFLFAAGGIDATPDHPGRPVVSRQVTVKLSDKPMQFATKKPSFVHPNGKTRSQPSMMENASEQSSIDEEVSIESESRMPEPIRNNVENESLTAATGQVKSKLESDTAFQGALQKLAAPCRSISLPAVWMRLKDFWPRRYRAEFEFRDAQSGSRINLTRLVPEAEIYPALDERIFKSFSSCLQDQFSRRDVGTSEMKGILTPESGEAYSVLMEFSPRDTRVASQQGI